MVRLENRAGRIVGVIACELGELTQCKAWPMSQYSLEKPAHNAPPAEMKLLLQLTRTGGMTNNCHQTAGGLPTPACRLG